MIDHNQNHCDPPDIINVHLSHKNTTFAIIFNIIVKITKVVSSKSALQIYVIPVKKVADVLLCLLFRLCLLQFFRAVQINPLDRIGLSCTCTDIIHVII